MAAKTTRRARKKSSKPAKRARGHKKNPQLLLFGANRPCTWTKGAKRIGKEVDSIKYVHVRQGPRVHEFERNGVRMECLPDGSIRIFHPTYRLWEEL